MIEIKDVSLTYPDGTPALKNVNLNIVPGELVYITGPSGSGKTSLLKLLLGMEFATLGSVTVLGQPMKKESEKKINRLRRRIGPVFQEFKLIQGRTALENVITGMRFLGIPPRKMKEEAADVLKKVGLEHKAGAKVDHLSWGEAQRVAIARAVARKPALFLADEPTGNLDHDNALNILHILNTLRNADTAVIITTHATHLIENQEGVTHVRVNKGDITVERRGAAG